MGVNAALETEGDEDNLTEGESLQSIARDKAAAVAHQGPHVPVAGTAPSPGGHRARHRTGRPNTSFRYPVQCSAVSSEYE